MVKGDNSNSSNKRVFYHGGDVKYFIETPTADDIRDSDWHYSKVYSMALKEGVPTQAEMQDILKDRGIIGDAYDAKVEELKESITEKIIEMELEKKKDKKKSLAVEISKLREDLFAWNQRAGGPLSHTCEQMAEDSKIEHLTSSIVKDSEGNAVWKSFEEYKTESKEGLAFRARFEVMLFLQGLEPDFLEKTPENVVLKEMSEEGKSDVSTTKKSSKPKRAKAKKTVKKTAKKKAVSASK